VTPPASGPIETMADCGSEGGSDHLRYTVPTEDDHGEATCDHREKKGGCDGVFHEKPSKQRAPGPRREG
jgi:hypothetical protein